MIFIVDYHLNDENGLTSVKQLIAKRKTSAYDYDCQYSPELQSLTKQHHITLLNNP